MAVQFEPTVSFLQRSVATHLVSLTTASSDQEKMTTTSEQKFHSTAEKATF